MDDLLYLDTARLGRPTPAARAALRDFADLAADEGGSAYFERFLHAGFADLPAGFAGRYPGLAGWRGVGPLKDALRTLAGDRPGLPVLLAARSAQLMRLAARALCHPCRHVLAVDLGWPPYHDLLAAECRRAGRALTVLPLRRAVLGDGAGADEVVERVARAAVRGGCDGLFLPAVSSDGVRLPVERIVRAVESATHLWFVAVDGAQAFGHAGADLGRGYCDLYLAGGHKWLGAYHPLGLGFYGRRATRGLVETVAAGMTAAGELDDPLLRLTAGLEAGDLGAVPETVDLGPLFAAHGAAADAVAGPSLADRVAAAGAAGGVALGAGWVPVRPAPGLRSGILLIRPDRPTARPALETRAAFRDRGVALTAYQGSLVRLSVPPAAWGAGGLDHLGAALRSNA